MTRVTKALTNTEIAKAKPQEKEYSLADGKGLFLRIRPDGTKTCIFNYAQPYTKKRTNLVSTAQIHLQTRYLILW